MSEPKRYILTKQIDQGAETVIGQREIVVLFARSDSIYKSIQGCDVWDKERNALLWPGGMPLIAHPPCRAWGRLRTFAHPEPGEKELALWAVDQVKKYGGVLEHPYGSLLWKKAKLPQPGWATDPYRDGWTLQAPQFWWGHLAEKNSLFYIVGCSAHDLPEIPFRMGEPSHVVQSRKRTDYRPHIRKADREHTPVDLAKWLCELARKCEVRK